MVPLSRTSVFKPASKRTLIISPGEHFPKSICNVFSSDDIEYLFQLCMCIINFIKSVTVFLSLVNVLQSSVSIDSILAGPTINVSSIIMSFAPTTASPYMVVNVFLKLKLSISCNIIVPTC